MWSSATRSAFALVVCTFVLAQASKGSAGIPSQAPGFPVPLAFAGLSLRQAEEKAIAQSPEVAVARARADAASAGLALARTNFGPSIVAGYTQNPQAGPGTIPTSISQRSVNVGLQSTIGNVLAYLPTVTQAQAANRGARAQEIVAERNERFKVDTLYYAALRSHLALQVRIEALELAKAQQRAAQRRFDAGDAPRIDVVRALVAVAQATADEAHARAADENALEALRVEAGVRPDTLTQPISNSLPAPVTSTLSSGSAVDLALSRRTEVVAAQLDVSAADAVFRAAKISLLPLVTVSAGYAHGTDVGQPVAGPTVNASLELPLTGASSAHVAQSRAALDEANAKLAGARRQVSLEAASSTRNLEAAMLATKATSQAREAAQEQLKATDIGYRSGASSSLERASASATYAEARLAEINAVYDEALARIAVELETGL